MGREPTPTEVSDWVKEFYNQDTQQETGPEVVEPLDPTDLKPLLDPYFDAEHNPLDILDEDDIVVNPQLDDPLKDIKNLDP